MPAALVTRFEKELGAPFTIVFGQTECSPVAAMTKASDTIEDKANTIGPPMPNMETKIVSLETGDIAAIGEVGECCTRGYHIMHGYFDMPQATAAAIDGDGWLHTGDLCAMDERGYCTVEGRLKDMTIRGGEKISIRVNSRNCCFAIRRSPRSPSSECPAKNGERRSPLSSGRRLER